MKIRRKTFLFSLVSSSLCGSETTMDFKTLHSSSWWKLVAVKALWAFFLCFEKVRLLHTQSISGLKWETVLIEPQIQQKGLKLSNTHSPISIQKHDSARSCSFRKRKKKKMEGGGWGGGIVLFPRGKPLFSISSQHIAAAAASAFQLESDQAATSGRAFNTSTVILGIKHRRWGLWFPFIHSMSSSFLSLLFLFIPLISILFPPPLLSFPSHSSSLVGWHFLAGFPDKRVVWKQRGGTVITGSVLWSESFHITVTETLLITAGVHKSWAGRFPYLTPSGRLGSYSKKHMHPNKSIMSRTMLDSFNNFMSVKTQQPAEKHWRGTWKFTGFRRIAPIAPKVERI